MDPFKVISFWFPNENYQAFWFDHSKDDEIKKEFGGICDWLIDNIKDIREICNNNYLVKLACIILLDQMLRNISKTIRHDDVAFNIACEMVEKNEDLVFDNVYYRIFILMPFRHQKKSDILYTLLTRLNSYDEKYKSTKGFKTFYEHTLRSFTPLQDEIEFLTKGDLMEQQYSNFKHVINDACLPYINNEPEKNIAHTRIYNVVKDFVKSNNLMALCVSLSGGVDSMVLSFILNILLQEKVITDIIAVHLNYSNRVEADDEAIFIMNWCRDQNIGLVYRKIKHMTRDITNIDRTFYENETKKIRFELYKIVQNELKYDGTCLGHHKDDLAENILMNMRKRISLLDLVGMSQISVQDTVTLFRPMLGITKEEIYDFAHTYMVPYTKDTTPAESIRGQLRTIILPCLQSFGLDSKCLCEMGLQGASYKQLIDEQIINPFLKSIQWGKNQCKMNNVSKIVSNKYIFETVLKHVFYNFGKNMIKKTNFNYIYSQICKNKKYKLSFSNKCAGLFDPVGDYLIIMTI